MSDSNVTSFPSSISRRLQALNVVARSAAVGIGCGVIGCGGAESGAPPTAAPTEMRSEAIEHQPCGGGARSEALDTNGDGKTDITRYYDASGHEICRVVDLNRDGKPDLYEYLSNGQVVRRELCYDDSGTVNAIEHYEGGRLVRREYDIAGQHRIDTWDWFDPAVPVDAKTNRPAHPTRRERDTKGNGHIDQWWTWNGDQLTIAIDRDGDGKPDPQATLVFAADGGAPVAVDPSSAPNGGTSGAPATTASQPPETNPAPAGSASHVAAAGAMAGDGGAR